MVQQSFATKTCPPLECGSPADHETCFKKATWVATGKIINRVDKIIGKPLNKNFARFDFKIIHWEKGEKPNRDQISLKIGWCNNQRELPATTDGTFRFYGKSLSPENDESQFIDYLLISE